VSVSSKAASYLVVLRLPLARRTFVAALVGRLSYGIVFLALLLTITRATSSYTVAGSVLALFGLGSFALAPYRARLIDRYGPRRALPPMAAVYAALLVAIAAAAWQPGTSRPILWLLGAGCGACAPPLGPFMRTLWAVIVPPEGELLQRAYALDTVAEDLLYVIGPLLAGLFTAYANPAVGVAVSAAMVLIGSVAVVTSPVVSRLDHQQTPDEASPGAKASKRASKLRQSLWGGTGLFDPVIISGGLGICLGALNLLAVSFAGSHGGTALVAWVDATMAAGSALGGLIYGAISWQIAIRLRLPLLAAFFGLLVAVAGQSGSMPVLVVVAGGAGLFVSPILVTAYLIANEASSPGSRTEAGTWVNTAFNAGNSAGTAGIGLFFGLVSLPLCFTIAAAAIVLPAAEVATHFCWSGIQRMLRLGRKPVGQDRTRAIWNDVDEQPTMPVDDPE